MWPETIAITAVAIVFVFGFRAVAKRIAKAEKLRCLHDETSREMENGSDTESIIVDYDQRREQIHTS